jgi:ATP-dependent protease ClpP protease subunit
MELIQIENRSGKVRLNDSVNPWSTDDLIADLEKLYGKKAVEDKLVVGNFVASADEALERLDIEINSPGGSVLDGYRIYHAMLGMRQRGVYITATINPLAASMASVIAMAADVIRMVSGGRMMIHEASQTVSGDSADHARAAKILDEMSDEIAGIYAKKTGAEHDEMRALMKAETWMGSTEAIQRGFVDEILIGVPLDIRDQNSTSPDMTILSKLFPGNAQVEQIEAQVSQIDNLTSDLAAAEAKIAELSNLSQVVAEKSAELTEVKAKLETTNAELVEAKAKIEEAEQSAAAKAVALAAEAGIEAPLPITASEKPANEVPTLTRAEFNKLPPSSRLAHVRAGGKLTN